MPRHRLKLWVSRGLNRMRSNGHSTLRIYVAQHCASCAEALRLAEEIRRNLGGINLELIDLDAEGSLNIDDVFSVPTYVLDGRTVSLGNPNPEELFSRLAAIHTWTGGPPSPSQDYERN